MAKKTKAKAEPRPVGRPTDYKPEYCQAIIDYFSVKPYELTEKEIIKDGHSAVIQVNEASDFPSFAGFAAKMGVCRDTIQEWCDKHPEFSVAHKKAKVLQESWMTTNGMKSLINTPFAIFTAKNVLGWRDQKEVKATVGQTVKQESSPEDKKQLDLLAEFLKTKLSDRKKA